MCMYCKKAMNFFCQINLEELPRDPDTQVHLYPSGISELMNENEGPRTTTILACRNASGLLLWCLVLEWIG